MRLRDGGTLCCTICVPFSKGRRGGGGGVWMGYIFRFHYAPASSSPDLLLAFIGCGGEMMSLVLLLLLDGLAGLCCVIVN